MGNEAAPSEKPLPEMVAEFTVRAALPFDRIVTVCVLGLATVTLPKASDVGLTEI